MNQAIYQRRLENGTVLSSRNPTEVWRNWNPDRERWLFVAAHDDDIISGGGLTFIAAAADGIDVEAAITSTGQAGYCRPEHKGIVQDLRRQEAIESFAAMGIPEEKIYFLGFPDAQLPQFGGHRWTNSTTDSCVIAGSVGLQNSYTWLLRKTRPTRVFLPALTDLHPDHQTTHTEMLISIFHAHGNIWPELGLPMETIPLIYEYQCYSDFCEPPDMRILVDDELMERKLACFDAYRSQEQIEMTKALVRQFGPKEYIREKRFDMMIPGKYDYLFDAEAEKK